jgi:hypothetical protein
LPVAKQGFNDLEKAHIARVQMTSDVDRNGIKNYNGIQTKLECQASFSSMLYPSVVSAQSPLMSFGDCAIQFGNSGSPIINSKGEIAAILQGYLSVKQDPHLLDELKKYLLDESYGQLGIGTQLQCVPELGSTRGCGQLMPFDGEMPEDFIKDYQPFNENTLPRVLRTESWKRLTSSSTEVSVLRVPNCIPAQELRVGAVFSFAYQSYRKGINRFLQAEWRPRFEEGERKVAYSIKRVLPDGGELVTSDQALGLGQVALNRCR